jgi:hypothetical protein
MKSTKDGTYHEEKPCISKMAGMKTHPQEVQGK